MKGSSTKICRNKSDGMKAIHVDSFHMYFLMLVLSFFLFSLTYLYCDDASCATLPLCLSAPCRQVLEQTPAAEISLVVRSLPLHHVDAVMALLRCRRPPSLDMSSIMSALPQPKRHISSGQSFVFQAERKKRIQEFFH